MKKIGAESKTKASSKFVPQFNHYGTEFYYSDLNLLGNEKAKEKFIKAIEAIIRTSLEYRAYIKYLKTEALLTQCVVMNKLPEEVSGAVNIEMHHCPLTLYDLVDIVLTRYLKLDLPFTKLSIANEVMNAHYLNEVGIVPMTKTMHQMIHTGINLVTKNDIFGNYKAFVGKYEVFVSEEHRNKVERLEKLPEKLVYNTRRNFLEVNPALYLEHDQSDEDVVHLPPPEAEELDDDNELEEMPKPKIRKKKTKQTTNIIEEET